MLMSLWRTLKSICIYEIPIRYTYINKLSQLPFHHCAPLDGTLIAQALTDNLSIITKEQLFEEYGVTRI